MNRTLNRRKPENVWREALAVETAEGVRLEIVLGGVMPAKSGRGCSLTPKGEASAGGPNGIGKSHPSKTEGRQTKDRGRTSKKEENACRTESQKRGRTPSDHRPHQPRVWKIKGVIQDP